MLGLLLSIILWILDLLRSLFVAVGGEKTGKLIDPVSRKVSGKHKLQRISSSYKGLAKLKRLESCLANSNNQILKDYKEYTDVHEFSGAILREKDISASKDPEFIARINTTFHPICEINRLTKGAVALKRTKYDSANEEHEMLLFSLWNCLQPEVELDDRISDLWADIGFQGTDPATDFRGMGILGLQNLHYLAKHKKSALKLLSASNHPQYGFSLAITSINLTAILMEMLEGGLLRNHFHYKCCHGGARTLTLTDLHEAHCTILSDFINFYQDNKPATIMEFNIHKAAFAEILKIRLLSDNPHLENVE